MVHAVEEKAVLLGEMLMQIGFSRRWREAKKRWNCRAKRGHSAVLPPAGGEKQTACLPAEIEGATDDIERTRRRGAAGTAVTAARTGEAGARSKFRGDRSSGGLQSRRVGR